MSLLSGLFNNGTSTLKDPSDELVDSLLGAPSNSGQYVTPDNSLRVTAVYSCVRVLSETRAALPLNLYKRLENGDREIATDNILQEKLHFLPNDEMTSFDLGSNQMVSLLLRGNSFNEVARDRAGRVQEIVPINPDHVEVGRSKSTGKLTYEVHNGDVRTINKDRMWRITGMGTNGLIGLSPISLHRESIGLSMALEEHGARLFSNGAAPGGVLSYTGRLDDPAKKLLKDKFNQNHQGTKNSHKVAILPVEVKWSQLGLSSEDAQYLESRKFQRNEIASIYGVPPHMVGDLENATFSNIENLSIQFLIYSLLPWLKRIEQSIYRDLLTVDERKVYFAEHNVEGLLRGDLKARSEFYRTLFNLGSISIDELRRLENMNKVDGEGGDKHWLQTSMAPIDNRPDYNNETIEITEPDKK